MSIPRSVGSCGANRATLRYCDLCCARHLRRAPGWRTASRSAASAVLAGTTASIGARSQVAFGRLAELGDTVSAEEAAAAIQAEIDRERAVFNDVCAEPGAELDLLRVSMTLAHNRGDLTQAMSFRKRTSHNARLMEHFSARGRFEVAVRIYQHTGLSSEGHRHYPLRPVKALRRAAITLLPLCPFLDAWGKVVAQLDEIHEVLAALVIGCQKVQGQQGYYRAIAGMRAASSGAFDRAAGRIPNSTQRLLRSVDMRKRIDLPRVSFESTMRKRASTTLAIIRGRGFIDLSEARLSDSKQQ